MIILDTNVISELMRVSPDSRVTEWVSSQKSANLAITAIAIAEIQRGILRLPQGKKRESLQNNFIAFTQDAFKGRIYAFDEHAANIYGVIAAETEQSGFNTDVVDLMIAAIVKSRNAVLATRNIKDFKNTGITVINPWDM